MWTHSREGARRLLRVLCLQPLHCHSRYRRAARAVKTAAGNTGATTGRSDWIGQECPGRLV